MYGCESWTIKKAECWIIDSFELCCWRKLESPLGCKEIQPVNPKGNQSWIFIGRTDAGALVLWPPDMKKWLIRKDPDPGKDWRQKEEGMTEDEMVGWHHWLNGHEFEQAPGVGNGQGSLACCSSWDPKESDMTEWLDWTDSTHKWVKSLSRVRLFVTPWTVAYQAPPSMGFSRQEYWSELPFPTPGESSQSRDPTWVFHVSYI